MTEQLRAELETALARALATAWDDLNRSHFKASLRRPALRLSESLARLGEWNAAERTIALARGFVVDGAWGRVIEVLKHEMAHQYASEVLGEPDGAPHGPAFRALCEKLGIDARASGLPDAGESPPGAEEARVLSRIAKLLALSGSANQHEAELAMGEAQRLMLKHNLDAAPSRTYAFRHLGEPTGRTSEHERILAGLLGEHFFVEAIWVPVWRARQGRRGSVLEVCGTPVNLELAEYVHTFLLGTAERLWREYKKARGITRDAERRTFLAGVMAGFREKLDAQRRRQQQEGLVWVGDGDLARFLKKRHPYVRQVYTQGQRRTEAHAHGRAAGRNVVLHRPMTTGPSGGGRMLPPRR
jgi:hypothetical protein